MSCKVCKWLCCRSWKSGIKQQGRGLQEWEAIRNSTASGALSWCFQWLTVGLWSLNLLHGNISFSFSFRIDAYGLLFAGPANRQNKLMLRYNVRGLWSRGERNISGTVCLQEYFLQGFVSMPCSWQSSQNHRIILAGRSSPVNTTKSVVCKIPICTGVYIFIYTYTIK